MSRLPLIMHLDYVHDFRYRHSLHLTLRRFGVRPGAVSELETYHEPDGICCNLERWPVTIERIVRGVTT